MVVALIAEIVTLSGAVDGTATRVKDHVKVSITL